MQGQCLLCSQGREGPRAVEHLLNERPQWISQLVGHLLGSVGSTVSASRLYSSHFREDIEVYRGQRVAELGVGSRPFQSLDSTIPLSQCAAISHFETVGKRPFDMSPKVLL